MSIIQPFRSRLLLPKQLPFTDPVERRFYYCYRRSGLLQAAVVDSFDRANSTTSLGNADTGQPWTALGGTWGINGNAAYNAVNAATDINFAVLDAGKSDVLYTITLSAIGVATHPRFVFRAVDLNNLWYVNDSPTLGVGLFKIVAGVLTTVQAFGGRLAVAGDIITIQTVGSSIACSVNGTLAASATDSFNQTATKFGIGVNVAGGAPNCRWNNLAIL